MTCPDSGASRIPCEQRATLFYPARQPPPLYDSFCISGCAGRGEISTIDVFLVFFLSQSFCLGRAGRHLMESSGGHRIIFEGALWPFGSAFGRLATWYSFSFFPVGWFEVLAYPLSDNQTDWHHWAFFYFYLWPF